jgi:magnesium-transporting ATPase (P-type)
MTTRIKLPNGKYRIFCKGAAEMVVDLCVSRYRPDGAIERFDAEARANTLKVIDEFADLALRTIALAVRECPPWCGLVWFVPYCLEIRVLCCVCFCAVRIVASRCRSVKHV